MKRAESDIPVHMQAQLSSVERRKSARRDRRIQKRRKEILQAAKEMFLRRPYSEVTMDDVADTAGVSRGTIYSYFRTKAEIYSGVLYEDMDMLAAALSDAYRPNAGVADNIRSMTFSYMLFFERHPEYFEKLSFFFYPGREERLPADVAADIEHRLAEAIEVVEECIRVGIERGEARPQDPRTAAIALWGMWMGTAYAAVTGHTERFERPFEQVYSAGVENFLNGLIGPSHN